MIDNIKSILFAVVLAFFQAFILQHVEFSAWLRPMPYMLLLLTLPLQTNKFTILSIAFFYGTFIDLLSGNFGIHSGSMVVLAFVKNIIDNKFVDDDSLTLQGENFVTKNSKGYLYYAYYTLSLIFVHHLTFFSLDYFELRSILRILGLTIGSSLFTFSFIELINLIYKKR